MKVTIYQIYNLLFIKYCPHFNTAQLDYKGFFKLTIAILLQLFKKRLIYFSFYPAKNTEERKIGINQ